MKKYALLVLATLLMMSVAITAQEQQTPLHGRRAEKKELKQGERAQMTPQTRAERMAKELGLTDSERKKVQALFERQEAKRVQHQAEIDKQKARFREKFEAERKVQDAELEKIIGKEKFQKMETKRAQQMEKMKLRKDRMPGDSTSHKNRPHRERMNMQ